MENITNEGCYICNKGYSLKHGVEWTGLDNLPHFFWNETCTGKNSLSLRQQIVFKGIIPDYGGNVL